MINRYMNARIAPIWTDEYTLLLWQKTELAAIQARVAMGELDVEIYQEIANVLLAQPIDLIYWRNRDFEIHHDLNAFIDERVRHLDEKLQEHFHKKLTSFDTIEPAFSSKLFESLLVIGELYERVETALVSLARKYRYTIMNARTHGQEAELQTFGARCLTWLQQLRLTGEVLDRENKCLKFSKLSGAIGKYGSIDPELEKEALRILGLEPFHGATQIIPRILYLPLAQGLSAIVQVLNNIAMDIRLSARSGRPLMREPFKKRQKGSSAMPHKKNPIRCEQIEGMDRMARSYLHMIEENVRTWEERAIEQSSVERIAWPDLFHVTARSLSETAYVLEDLRVYPENMLLEVYESRGVYASSEVKEFLKERVAGFGLDYEDAYRMVQLACFNVFTDFSRIASWKIESFDEANQALVNFKALQGTVLADTKIVSIEEFIPMACLCVSEDLDISSAQVHQYNNCLRIIFDMKDQLEEWHEIFKPEFLLKHQDVLYKKILGE